MPASSNTKADLVAWDSVDSRIEAPGKLHKRAVL